MFLETGTTVRRNRILKGDHHFYRKKRVNFSKADHFTKLINLGHSKWVKIAPQISADLEGIIATPR